MADLITAANLKTYLSVDDSDDDTLISLRVSGVSELFISRTGRSFSVDAPF